MLFDEYIGIDPEIIDYTTVRHSVKGISIDGNKILLLETNRNDYTFPGGGIEPGESHLDTLVREVLEETGYTCVGVGSMVGRCSLRRVDIFDDSMMYEMISHYYTFKSSKESQDLQLSVREQEIELRPVWIDIEEAIIKNKKYLDECSTDNFLKQQEILVLELIQDSSEMISAMFI